MKKLFNIALALMCSTTIFAARTARCTITLTSNQTDVVSNDVLNIMEYDNQYSNEFGDEDTRKNMNSGNAYSLNIYSIQGTEDVSTVRTNEVTNLPILVETDEVGTKFTMTFSNVEGTLYFYDLDNTSETPFVIEAAGDHSKYEFTVTSAGRRTIENRFFINFSAVTSVTTNDYGWASFSYDQDLVPVNATAQTLYKGAINGEYLDLTAVDYIPDGQGVLVKSDANTTYYFAAGSGNDVFDDNALKATATYTTSMQNVYVLKGNAFLEYVGTNALAANKAYIQLPAAGPNNAPARISMRFNGTQDVENVEKETIKAEKFVENGQVLIRRGNEVFNLQGQKVNF